MSGRKFLLDTNAIIQLLRGNAELSDLLANADFISTSIIAEMEYLSFSDLPESDVTIFQIFKSRITVYDVPSDDMLFTQLAVDARKKFKMKLPDAIIAATARTNDLTILTADDHFKSLTEPWHVHFYTPV